MKSEFEVAEETFVQQILAAVDMGKVLLWEGYATEVQISIPSQTVYLRAKGSKFKALKDVMDFFRIIDIHAITKQWATSSNRLVFYAEKNGVRVKINSELPSCREATLKKDTIVLTKSTWVCPKTEDEG